MLLFRFETEEEKEKLVPMLREVARQEYLRKREEQKLKELEDELLDAKYLFEGVELTEKEKADLKYKEQVSLSLLAALPFFSFEKPLIQLSRF